jgi:hypothetical protein
MDIEWERNGLLNYDRTPKVLGYDPRDVNSADFLVLDAPPCQTVRPADTVEIPVLAAHFGQFVGDHAVLKWRLELTDWLGRTEMLREAPGRRCPFPRFAVTPVGPIKATMPDGPGLVTLRAWLETAAGDTIARNWAHFHVPGDPDALSAAPQAAWVVPMPLAAFEGDRLARFDVEGEAQAIWFEGAGQLSARVSLPADVAIDKIRSVEFVAELSSCRPGGGGKQTDHETWPSRIQVAIGPVDLGAVELHDQPADARGVLSHHYGFAGRYGQLVSLAPPSDALHEIRQALAAGAEISLRVEGHLQGGLCVYGLMTGRYPNRPGLVLGCEPQE